MQDHYEGMAKSKEHVIARLKDHRDAMVENFNLFQKASVDAIQALDVAIAKEAEALHHLYGMIQGRSVASAAPAAPSTSVATPVSAPQEEAPAVDASAVVMPGPGAPGLMAQVSEMVEANGTRTITQPNGASVTFDAAGNIVQ